MAKTFLSESSSIANRKLNLDLHTHCLEAVGFSDPSIDVVARIIAAIKAKGLDGIAITDHARQRFARKVKAVVETHFDNTVLIIPGQEIDYGPTEIVELYLPGNCLFRFIAHPGYPGSLTLNGDKVQGIEMENGGHNWHMEKDKIIQFAHEHNLLLLKNSDAHYLEDIGKCYNELSWETLLKNSVKMAKSD